jgi:hypothetical protein
MGSPASDPLADALDALDASYDGSKTLKLDALFGDRPEVLESVRRARGRKVTFVEIARKLSSGAPVKVSEKAVAAWLHSQGIK